MPSSVETPPEAAVEVTPAIRVTNLTRTYKSGARVGPLTFEVPQGSITGLVGPNGVGKTTTIRMLLGLVTPDSGDLDLLGATSWRDLPSVLERVGALIEGPALVPTLSGRKNLLTLSRLAGWSEHAVDRALATVGLSERANGRVRDYSLGMRQRLALAGALLGDPDLLIVDEPANGLDPQGVAELRQLLRRVADTGTTVLVSSHVLAEVEQVCDHLVVLSDQGVAYHGSREDLAAQLQGSLLLDVVHPPDTPRLRGLLRRQGFRVDITSEGSLRVHPGGDQSSGMPEGGSLNAMAFEAGIVLARIQPDRQSLEDIFFELTGDPGTSGDRLGLDVIGVDAPSRSPFRRKNR